MSDDVKYENVSGANLKPGDVIIPWYEKQAIIETIKPYTGNLSYLFPEGARSARFSKHSEFDGGMTIDNSDIYKRVIK